MELKLEKGEKERVETELGQEVVIDGLLVVVVVVAMVILE